ncbi:MAG: 50S ribosomal protein L25 [Dehalococcoidia bacterium]|nr:MAG: 50S ribosomal protein L25 [Dehalococcoidia bacterium]
MVKREELKVKSRDTLGKKVRFLRRQGLTPANLYGPKTESIPLQVETSLLERLIATAGRNAIITLKVDGEPRLAMIRDIQRDPLTGALLHVGFFQIEVTHKVRAEIPLIFLGEAPAAKIPRAMLIQNLTSLQVEGLPTDLPRRIEVDLSLLQEINQAIHVREIPIDDRLEVVTDPDQVVVHVEEPRAPVEEVEVKEEIE